MKVLVVVPDYPNEGKISYQFVHERVKNYLPHFDVDVFALNNNNKEYSYENVNVICGNLKKLKSIINNYDKYVFHFLNNKSAYFILRYLKNKKVFVWFHGSDSVSYKRRLDRINYSKKKLINPKFLLKVIAFIVFNKIKFFNIIMLNKKCKDITFVFVSDWNKNASEKDINIKYKNYKVIPNYVDFDKFIYKKKSLNQRLNVLSINNYSNNIYAGDMTQDIIVSFSKEKEFSKFKFLICGTGKLFNEYTKDIMNFDNVEVKNKVFTHDEIAKLQEEYGVFLYPKRGDSQGVSRCEAMASGLVSVASDVEAISEFSPSSTTYLVNSVPEFVESLKSIYYNKNEYEQKSVNSYKFIKEKCSYENTIKKEIELLRY